MALYVAAATTSPIPDSVVLLVMLNPPPPPPKAVLVLQTPLLVLIGYLSLPLPLPLPLEPLEDPCSTPDPSDDLLRSLPALPDES